MAGIKGQPGTKPKDAIKAQSSNPYEEFAIGPSQEGESNPYGEFAEPNAMESAGAGQAVSPTQEGEQVTQFPGAGFVQGVADVLPTALAIGGGLVGGAVVGAPTGGVGSVPGAIAGATIGGTAGYGYKRWIETNILGKQINEREDSFHAAGREGAMQGAGQAVGLGIAKGVGVAGKAALSTKAGKAVAEKTAQLAEKPANFAKGVLDATKEKILEPLTSKLMQKTTKLGLSDAGKVIQQKFTNALETKYSLFKTAYDDIDKVSRSIPIVDKSGIRLANKMNEMGKNLLNEDKQVVQALAENMANARNIEVMENVVGKLDDKITAAWSSKNAPLAKKLTEMRDYTQKYIDGRINYIAKKAASGSASPEELSVFQNLMAQKGMTGGDPKLYAKDAAKNFLKERVKVDQEYAKFHGLIEDIQESTGKFGKMKGPGSFINNLREAPPDQLVNKMFTDKNLRALQNLKANYPDVYDQVVKSKFTQIMNDASPGNELSLDLLAAELRKIKNPEVRALLIDPSDEKMLYKFMKSNKLKAIDSLQNEADSSMLKLFHKISLVSGIAAKGTAKGVGAAASSTPGRQVMGNTLVNVFGGRNDRQQK